MPAKRSIRPLCPSVHPSVRVSVCPSRLSNFHDVGNTFQGLSILLLFQRLYTTKLFGSFLLRSRARSRRVERRQKDLFFVYVRTRWTEGKQVERASKSFLPPPNRQDSHNVKSSEKSEEIEGKNRFAIQAKLCLFACKERKNRRQRTAQLCSTVCAVAPFTRRPSFNNMALSLARRITHPLFRSVSISGRSRSSSKEGRKERRKECREDG